MRDRIRDFEFRFEDSADGQAGNRLVGYATVFGQDTQIDNWEGRFTERMAPGAFQKTLTERKPVMLFDHGRNITVPIGVYDVIREDAHGMYVEGSLFDNELVRPVRDAIAGGAVTGMSVRMEVLRDEWRDGSGNLVKGDALRRKLYSGEDGLVRTIKEVRCRECGPVTFPAYEGTSVGMRAADTPEEQRDAVIAEYQRTMLKPSATDEITSDVEEDVLRSWLDAENTFRWLEAESVYRWLEAEKEFKTSVESDAAIERTSDDTVKPESNAAQKSTLHRESRKEEKKPSASKNVRKRAMTLAELRERLVEIDATVAALGEEYRDAEMSTEDQAQFDELRSERPKVEARIKAIEERMEALKGGVTERGAGFGTNVIVKKDIFDLDEMRSATPQELRDNAKRAIDESRFGGRGLTTKEEAQATALRALEDQPIEDQTELARRYLLTGSPAYRSAWGKAVAAGSREILVGEEYRALSLGTDGKGGYAVPFQLDPTVILTTAGVIDPLRSISRTEQIVGKEWQGITSAGTSVSRAAEAAEVTAGDFTLNQPTVRTKRVQGFIPFSYELAETWGAVESEITRALADAKATEEANSFMNGDGTGNNANGLLGTITTTTIKTAGVGALAAADFYSLEEALDPRYRNSGRAKFVANHQIYNRLRGLATANDHSLWVRIGAGQPAEVMGYQALESTAMSGDLTAATAAKIVIFGDFSNFLIVDRIGMSVELIPQVFGTANNLPTGQRGIFAIWMNNSKVLVDNAFKVLQVKAA